MLDLRECLFVTFTYDHASGLYQAQLPNSARFTFDDSNVSGKLQNALSLFKRAVIALHSGRFVQAKKKPDFIYSYDESQVRRVGRGAPSPKVVDLGLNLGELQL